MTPDSTKGLEVYADMDFCGLFDPEMALNDPVTAKKQKDGIYHQVHELSNHFLDQQAPDLNNDVNL